MKRSNLPFGTSKSETVGEISSQGIPKFLLLLFWQLEKRVVVVLEGLVLLRDGRIVSPATIGMRSSTATTTSATAFTLHDNPKISCGSFNWMRI
jgi:hypothetical protein